MNPRDFLDVADELAAGLHEAHWRTAVSRAYYAAFHVARLLFGQCGCHVPHQDRAHAYLNMRLPNSGHPDMTEAGVRLHDLRRVRNQADYDLDHPFEQVEVFDPLQRSADIVRVLQDAAKLPTVLAQITQAMREYERDVLQDVTWRQPPPP